ncbi:MAG TPA: ferritin-like domain-containing protein, partial [Solirubrobacteraceae bacterium]|nr:ferritin-like domain-containing protein [Solirubrobacteraceae bacterium]
AGALTLARPAVAAAQAAHEADVLTRALRLEHTGLFAYDAVLAEGVLRGADDERARVLRGHEAEHAKVLAAALEGLSWPLPRPPRRVEDVEVPQVRVALDELRDRDGAVALLVELERLSLAAYRAGIARLRDARHIQLAATILAAEATHLVAWRTVG